MPLIAEKYSIKTYVKTKEEYDEIQLRAKTLDKTLSCYLRDLIRKDLLEAGIDPSIFIYNQ